MKFQYKSNDYHQPQRNGALAGLLVLLFPVLLPSLFSPLSHASPSMFSVCSFFQNYCYFFHEKYFFFFSSLFECSRSRFYFISFFLFCSPVVGVSEIMFLLMFASLLQDYSLISF